MPEELSTLELPTTKIITTTTIIIITIITIIIIIIIMKHQRCEPSALLYTS